MTEKPLPPREVNKVWWSGYCDDAVRYTASTTSGPKGRESRIRWLQKHCEECEECRVAALWKRLEFQAAATLGPSFEMEFFSGVGPDFSKGKPKKVLGKVIDQALKDGLLDQKALDLARASKERHGKTWPGHKEG